MEITPESQPNDRRRPCRAAHPVLCFYAHRSHLYQRLVIAGWRHRTVTLLYLALAWVGGLPGGVLAAALLPPLCALLLWWGVGRVEHRATVP